MQINWTHRLGTFGITVALPIVVYSFLFLCNDVSGCPAPSLLHPKSLTLEKLKQDVNWQGWHSLFNLNALYASLGWYGLSLLLYTILPAAEQEGTVLRCGGRLNYRFNGKRMTSQVSYNH